MISFEFGGALHFIGDFRLSVSLQIQLDICHTSFMTEGPVCVVKRFRRNPPEPLSGVQAGQCEPDSSVELSSFQLVDASHSLDQSALEGVVTDDFFGYQSDTDASALEDFDAQSAQDESCFRPRWNSRGEYDFFYQPGGPLPHVTGLGPRTADWGLPTSRSTLQTQPSTRNFGTVPFVNASASWTPPVVRRKYREAVQPPSQPHQSKVLQHGVQQFSSHRQTCPDAAVVRSPLPVVVFNSPVTSMQQAWHSAKRELLQQWLHLLDQMGESSGLVVATSQSAISVEHRQRVVEKFAPSTLQSYFRIWSRWFEFSSTLQTCPFQPPTVLLADFLAEHTHGPLGVATGYHKGLTWMAKHAQLPLLGQALQEAVCKAYLKSSAIGEKRESAPLPLSFVIYLEKMVLAKSTLAGDILQLGGLLFLIWASLRWSDATWIAPESISIQQHAMFAVATHTKTTNRGMPVACYAFGLLGHQGTSH